MGIAPARPAAPSHRPPAPTVFGRPSDFRPPASAATHPNDLSIQHRSHRQQVFKGLVLGKLLRHQFLTAAPHEQQLTSSYQLPPDPIPFPLACQSVGSPSAARSSSSKGVDRKWQDVERSPPPAPLNNAENAVEAGSQSPADAMRDHAMHRHLQTSPGH